VGASPKCACPRPPGVAGRVRVRVGVSKSGDSIFPCNLIGHGNRASVLPAEYDKRPVRAAGADYPVEYLLSENM